MDQRINGVQRRHRRWAHWSNGPVAFPFSCTTLLALLVRLLRSETSVKGPWVMSVHHFQLWNEEGPIYTSECLSSIHVFYWPTVCCNYIKMTNKMYPPWIAMLGLGFKTHLKNRSQNGNLPQFKGWKSKILETTTFSEWNVSSIFTRPLKMATPPLPTPVALPHATQRRPWETPGKPTEVVFQVKSIEDRLMDQIAAGKNFLSLSGGKISAGFD